MPLATPRQYAAMLDAAADGGYAYAAINVTSSETLNAALRGFKLANADGIVQISVGAAEYMSGTTAKDALLGARAFARYAHVVAERAQSWSLCIPTTARRRTSTIGCTQLDPRSCRQIGDLWIIRQRGRAGPTLD